jgi:hypothetical protein
MYCSLHSTHSSIGFFYSRIAAARRIMTFIRNTIKLVGCHHTCWQGRSLKGRNRDLPFERDKESTPCQRYQHFLTLWFQSESVHLTGSMLANYPLPKHESNCKGRMVRLKAYVIATRARSNYVTKRNRYFDALVSLYLVGRKPLYMSMGRGVMDPLTGAGFSVTN